MEKAIKMRTSTLVCTSTWWVLHVGRSGLDPMMIKAEASMQVVMPMIRCMEVSEVGWRMLGLYITK